MDIVLSQCCHPVEESRPSCPLRSAEILGPQNACAASSKLRKFKLNSSQISHDSSKIVMEQLTGNYMKWNYCKYKLENFTPNSLKLIKTFIIQNHSNYKETRQSAWCGVWSVGHKLRVLRHKSQSMWERRLWTLWRERRLPRKGLRAASQALAGAKWGLQPWDSATGRSEGLLRREGGGGGQGGQYRHAIWVKGRCEQSSTYFFQICGFYQVSAGLMKPLLVTGQSTRWRVYCFSTDEEIQEPGS